MIGSVKIPSERNVAFHKSRVLHFSVLIPRLHCSFDFLLNYRQKTKNRYKEIIYFEVLTHKKVAYNLIPSSLSEYYSHIDIFENRIKNFCFQPVSLKFFEEEYNYKINTLPEAKIQANHFEPE